MALAPLVEAGSFDPIDPKHLQAWTWWLKYGPQLAEQPWIMSPKIFASQAGYWLAMLYPVDS